MTWAERIKGLREELGLNQQEFARILNVTHAAVSQWESGRRAPTGDCEVGLVTLIEENRPLAELLLSEPIHKTDEPWSDRIRRLRKALNISQEDFARMLGVGIASIARWEEGSASSHGCIERMLDLLEFRFEQAASFFWPHLLSATQKWTSERVRALRKSLHLSQDELASLLRVGSQNIGSWENSRRPPGPCAELLLWFLEKGGEPFLDLLRDIAVDDVWSPDRIHALRTSLGLTLSEMNVFLGLSTTRFSEWEASGLETTNSGCNRTALSLLETYPEEMIALRQELPEFV